MGLILHQHFHARPRREFAGHLPHALAECALTVELSARRRGPGVSRNARAIALLIQNAERLHTLRLSDPALRLQLPRGVMRAMKGRLARLEVLDLGEVWLEIMDVFEGAPRLRTVEFRGAQDTELLEYLTRNTLSAREGDDTG
ncbi:hypothetical protein C8R44DRAFT_742743 [Mycena epipterygia]|nr:hypothetical protein C8R44DRAFT_742743 [Mycena epipterygia]